jgi:hypothetical protein
MEDENVMQVREIRSAYKIFVVKSGRKRPLERRRHGEDKIKVDVSEREWEGVD